MLELLKQNLENAPVVKFQDYNYFIFSIADGIPTIEPGDFIDDQVPVKSRSRP